MYRLNKCVPLLPVFFPCQVLCFVSCFVSCQVFCVQFVQYFSEFLSQNVLLEISSNGSLSSFFIVILRSKIQRIGSEFGSEFFFWVFFLSVHPMISWLSVWDEKKFWAKFPFLFVCILSVIHHLWQHEFRAVCMFSYQRIKSVVFPFWVPVLES